MTTDLSWMLEDIVTNVPKARHAVLLSADGISRGATQSLVDDDLRTISAAMAGMQALSRAAARFIEPSLHGAGASNGSEQGGRTGTVLADLDEVISGVHGARHAVLLGAEGLPLGATSGIDRDLVDTISAAMMGIHAYSRVTSQFAGVQAGAEWRQTVIEFQHGWIFLIAGDHGRLLAAAAEHDTDIEEFTTRLGEVVPRLTEERIPRQEAPSDV